MEREELGRYFWKQYKIAALARYNCDVGEWEDQDDADRESYIDALELVLIEAAAQRMIR